MGSDYTLYKDGKTEISIIEMFNRLELVVFDQVQPSKSLCTDEMRPADMLRLLMKGITATSYWMSEEEFKEVFSRLETYPL